MNFFTIDPSTQTIATIDVDDVWDAFLRAGLKRGRIDFGIVSRCNGKSVNIVVGEDGLINPHFDGKYFSLSGQLYAGPAVLFLANEVGDTVSFPEPSIKPPVTFYRDAAAVERAIKAGEINRPQTSINGIVIWEWGR